MTMKTWLSLFFLLAAPIAAQPVLKGYPTQLTLDGPVLAGESVTVTGSGAPVGNGIWVELWRTSSDGAEPESLASARADAGLFLFEGVDVAAGDYLHVTLSRSWQFETDGDAEGWGDCAGCLNDAFLSVEGGALRIELANLNNDPFTDAFVQSFFDYDPARYHVVEIRLLNPATPPGSPDAPTPVWLGLFWGAPWGTTISEHNSQIPAEMDDFETIVIPMNVDEVGIVPGPVAREDGLWDTGFINNTLRIDPINNIPPDEPLFDGTVVEIDWIRIREDYRFEFDNEGDEEGLGLSNDIDDIESEGGFLTYVVADVGPSANPDVGADGVVDPVLLSRLDTGRLDTTYFTRFALGIENQTLVSDPFDFGIFFDDADSSGYWDDCPPPNCVQGGTTLQQGDFPLDALGRQDVVQLMDDLTPEPGEWSEDGGRVPVATLRLDCPQQGTEGDIVRIDYYGWIPDEPFGPSDAVLVAPADGAAPAFLRGDATASGTINLSDGVIILNWLFLGGADLVCLDAADSDDSGAINLSDGVIILNWLFLGGPPPGDPGPETCGPDPSEDSLAECVFVFCAE